MKKRSTSIVLLFTTCCSFAQTAAGDNLFDTLEIHNIYINFSQPGYWTLLENNKAYDDANDSSTYIPAQVIVDGSTLDSVGIQFKGNSSYYNYPSNKKPFTLSFNEYYTLQRYDGLKSVNLNNLYQDPSFMREKIFLDFLNQNGLYAPRANYVKLYINNAYWGLYNVSERVNKTFLEDRFGNKTGNLFKGDANSGACADLKYYGTLPPYYNCYTLKTNELANNWTDLVNLTDKINNTSNAQFKDSVDLYLNSNSFIGSWAACNVFVDFDSYAFRFIHNYYIYHNAFTNKFEWITWDASTAFGMDVPETIPSIEGKSILYIEPIVTDRPLANRMLNDTAFKTQYLTFICDFINPFQPSVLNPKIDSIYNLIKNDVYADSLKMFSNTEFDNNINTDIVVSGISYPGLKSFILNRSVNIENELSSLGVDCSSLLNVSNMSLTKNSLLIYPNPAQQTFTIELPPGNFDLIISDITGRKTYERKNVNGQVQIDCHGFPDGIYFIQAINNKSVFIGKLIKG